MGANRQIILYDLSKVVDVAIGHFADHEPTVAEFESWLSAPPNKAALVAEVGSDEINRQIYGYALGDAAEENMQQEPDETSRIEPLTAIGLGAAATLGVLLNYIAGERRHRESMQSKQAQAARRSSVSGGDRDAQVVCHRETDDGDRCGLPISRLQITQNGQFVVVTCGRSPVPHCTVLPLTEYIRPRPSPN